MNREALSSFKAILLRAFERVRWNHASTLEDLYALMVCEDLPAELFLHVSIKGTFLAANREPGFEEVWVLELFENEYRIREVFTDD